MGNHKGSTDDQASGKSQCEWWHVGEFCNCYVHIVVYSIISPVANFSEFDISIWIRSWGKSAISYKYLFTQSQGQWTIKKIPLKQLQLRVHKLIVVLFTFRSGTGENPWWICIQRKLKNKRWVKIFQNGAIITYACFLNNKNHKKFLAVKWCLILDLCYISEVGFILFWIFSHSSMIW